MASQVLENDSVFVRNGSLRMDLMRYIDYLDFDP